MAIDIEKFRQFVENEPKIDVTCYEDRELNKLYHIVDDRKIYFPDIIQDFFVDGRSEWIDEEGNIFKNPCISMGIASTCCFNHNKVD